MPQPAIWSVRLRAWRVLMRCQSLGSEDEISGTIMTDLLNRVWDGMSGLFSPKEPDTAAADHEALANDAGR